MNTKKRLLLPLALLILAGHLSSFTSPRTTREEIKNLKMLLETKYPELKERALQNTWWSIIWSNPINAQQTALAAYLYSLLTQSKTCAAYIEDPQGNLAPFQAHYNAFQKDRDLILKNGLPNDLVEVLNNLDEGLKNDAQRVFSAPYPS